MLMQAVIRQSPLCDELVKMNITLQTICNPPICSPTSPEQGGVCIEIWTRPLNCPQQDDAAGVSNKLTTSTRLTGLPGAIIMDIKQIFNVDGNGYRLTDLHFELRHADLRFRDEGSLLFQSSPIASVTSDHTIFNNQIQFSFEADDSGFTRGDISILSKS